MVIIMARPKAEGKKKKYWDEVENLIVKNFVRLREERDWTQEELAEKIGKGVGYVGKIESGAGSFSLRAQLKFARIFEVPRIEFYKPLNESREEKHLIKSYRRLRDLGHSDKLVDYCNFLMDNYKQKTMEATE